MSDVKINYSKEMLIRDFPAGQAFVSTDEIWVKISVDSCVVVGNGKIVKTTPTCAAYPIRALEAHL